jgi:hypothetical protein
MRVATEAGRQGKKQSHRLNPDTPESKTENEGFSRKAAKDAKEIKKSLFIIY